MSDIPEIDFDWRTDETITVREQPSIAVYLNNYGQVTLRRERSWDEEDDVFIPIARENVLTVVKAILNAAGFEDAYLYEQRPGSLCSDIDWPTKDANLHVSREAKDRTGAERQRRYRRRKKRDAERDTVTGDGDVTPFPLLQAAE